MLKKTTTSLSHRFVHTASQSLVSMQHIITKSHTLRVFVYTAATLSVLPLGIFGIWVGATLLCTIVSAVAGVLLVEGGLVLVGLSVLVPVEGAILAIAGATAFTYASGGIGMLTIERFGTTVQRLSTSFNRLLTGNLTQSNSRHFLTDKEKH